MKKLILLLLMAFIVATAANAQRIYNAPANVSEWGAAGDTLIASVSDTVIFKVTSETVGKINLLLFTDAVSGTPAFTAVMAGSINQLSWVALDTITHSGGGDKLAYFTAQDLVYNYIRVIITATGAAQKQRLYLYGIIRK